MSDKSRSFISALMQRNKDLHYENKKLEGRIYVLEREPVCDPAKVEKIIMGLKRRNQRLHDLVGDLKKEVANLTNK